MEYFLRGMMKIKDVMVCISKRAIKDVKKNNKKYLIHPNNAEKKEQMNKEQM